MRWEHCPILGNEQDQKEQLGRAPPGGFIKDHAMGAPLQLWARSGPRPYPCLPQGLCQGRSGFPKGKKEGSGEAGLPADMYR